MIKLFSTISFFLICSFYSQASIEPMLGSDVGMITDQKNCFTDDMDTYESWISSIIKNHKHANVRLISKLVPRHKFENYKSLVKCFSFTYIVDGVSVKGYAVMPINSTAKHKYPVIIYNRGGNDSPAHALNFVSLFNFHMPLAERGYVVLSSQYRGAQIWPADTKFNTGNDEFGGEDVQDVLSLRFVVKQMPNADENRIGMFGWSRGGMMTFLALKNSNWVKSAVVGGAPTDLLQLANERKEMDEFVFDRLIPDYANNKEEQLKKRSVIYWAEDLRGKVPILILHGGADFKVPVRDSIRLAERLKALNHPHKLVIVPGASHGIREKEDLIISEVDSWFKNSL